jgi:hypothetical protein
MYMNDFPGALSNIPEVPVHEHPVLSKCFRQVLIQMTTMDKIIGLYIHSAKMFWTNSFPDDNNGQKYWIVHPFCQNVFDKFLSR